MTDLAHSPPLAAPVELARLRKLLRRYIRALTGRDVFALPAADAPYDARPCLSAIGEETAELVLGFLEAAPFASFKGPAIRHAISIQGREPSRTRILVIIGDRQPQEVDYGSGRTRRRMTNCRRRNSGG